MANARLEELKARFDENPRRYFAPYANELRKTGDLAQAVAICRSHLAVQPGHVSGHIVLAQALSESGALDESRAEFEAALELDPENLIALRAMGDLARESGDPTVAREWYQRVLDADPRNEEIARTLRDMSTVPNEFAPPPSAPAPLSMLVPNPQAVEIPGAASEAPAVPAAEAASPEHEAAPVAVPQAEAPVETSPASDSVASAPPEADMAELELPPAEVAEPLDDFIPFDSIDSIGSSADGRSAPPPPSVAAESVDLSDFTMMEPEASQDAEEPIAQQASSAEFAATWSDGDEFSVGEEDAAPPAADNEPARDAPLVSDTAWMSPTPPAADLSDYEAAPELVFEAEPAPIAPRESATAESAPNGANPGAQAQHEDDIETWFDMQESTAPPQQPVVQAGSGSETPSEAASETASAAPAAAWDAFANAPTEEIAGPGDDAPASAEPAPIADDVPSQPEPARSAGSPDPLIGRTPTLVEAIPESPAAPFVTETLAELYLQQGFRDEALAIYRQLLERNPSDLSLQRRAEAIERGAASDVVPEIAARSSTTGHRASMSVRTFFGRLARRTPSRPPSGGGSGRGSRTTGSWEALGGHRADAPADQTSQGGYGDGPVLEMAGESVHEAEERVEQPSALATLFAAARPSDSDTRAASALASAFTAGTSAPPPVGRPSRTAERELSLDHLFRDDAGGTDTESSPAAGSMDEFYGAHSPHAPPLPEAAPGGERGTTGAAPGGSGRAPDERNTDLRQFTAWLEGLKKK